MRKIIVLTGAGISAESGLGTFRDKGGIWTRYDLEDVATPEGFARDPSLVHAFYNERRRDLKNAEPNAAHHALAQLKQRMGDRLTIVTQNVDDLHERAGADGVIHMHGELRKALCAKCGARRLWIEDLSTETLCDSCGAVGGMRPDVVWFGEMPYQLDRICAAIEAADLFVSIGTSGQVYPAAGFVELALEAGAETAELNLEATSRSFHDARLGPATEVVPAWAAEIHAEIDAERSGDL